VAVRSATRMPGKLPVPPSPFRLYAAEPSERRVQYVKSSNAYGRGPGEPWCHRSLELPGGMRRATRAASSAAFHGLVSEQIIRAPGASAATSIDAAPLLSPTEGAACSRGRECGDQRRDSNQPASGVRCAGRYGSDQHDGDARGCDESQERAQPRRQVGPRPTADLVPKRRSESSMYHFSVSTISGAWPLAISQPSTAYC
jgi:hypothetical protein